MSQHIVYSLLSDPESQGNVFRVGEKYFFLFPCENSTFCSPYKIILSPGFYEISLLGARGGDGRWANTVNIAVNTGGAGGFVRGKLRIYNESTVFLYIGGRGSDQRSVSAGSFGLGGWNGGGNGGHDMPNEEYPESGAGGGGSTDIRLREGSDFDSLLSRVIVAGGGGGATSGIDSVDYLEYGGHGGGLNAHSYNLCSSPGSQVSGSFGVGIDGASSDGTVNGASGGNGGGYYGGVPCNLKTVTPPEKHTNALEFGGAGGSSFISGHYGCNAVFRYSDEHDIKHTNVSVIESSFIFYDTEMKSGNEITPNLHSINISDFGGNGGAIIQYLGQELPYCSKSSYINIPNIIFSFYFIVVKSFK